MIAIAHEVNPERRLLTSDQSLLVAKLSITDAGLADRVEIKQVHVNPEPYDWALDLLINEKIGIIYSGSERTLGILQTLIERGLWQGRIVTLNNSGTCYADQGMDQVGK